MGSSLYESPLMRPSRAYSPNVFRKKFTSTLWKLPAPSPKNSARIQHSRKRAQRKACCRWTSGAFSRRTSRVEELRNRIRTAGLRNSLLIAIAPTATIASIVGAFECIEPQISNLFKRETLSGDFLQINRHLVLELKRLGLWNEGMRNRLKVSDGSIQNISEIPEEIRAIYRTVWEVPMRSLIDMAADRGPFIDQSQSLNLFVQSPNIGNLSSMYMYAWKKGLKTTYYLRSRPATEIAKTTVPVSATQSVACSLENSESCDACQ